MVQGLFALIVAAPQSGAPVPPHSVNFIDEYDGWRRFLGLFEQVPDTTGAYTHKHFHKIGARQAEIGHVGFTGNGPGQQRLARSGRTQQQRPLGNFPTQFGELIRVLQKFNNFLKFLLGFVRASDIVKGHLRFVGGEKLGLALAEVENAPRRTAHAAALHPAHDKQPEHHQQQYRPGAPKIVEPTGVGFLELEAQIRLLPLGHQVAVDVRQNRDELSVNARLAGRRSLFQRYPEAAFEIVSGDHGRLHIVVRDILLKLGKAGLFRPAPGRENRRQHESDQHDGHPAQTGFKGAAHLEIGLLVAIASFRRFGPGAVTLAAVRS